MKCLVKSTIPVCTEKATKQDACVPSCTLDGQAGDPATEEVLCIMMIIRHAVRGLMNSWLKDRSKKFKRLPLDSYKLVVMWLQLSRLGWANTN